MYKSIVITISADQLIMTSYYAGIILQDLLCSILCCHNRPGRYCQSINFVSYDIQDGLKGSLICTHKPTKGKLDMSKGKYRYEINDNCACYFCYETLKFFPNLPCILIFLYYSNTSVTVIMGLLS